MEGGLERDEEEKGRGDHGQLPKGAHAPATQLDPQRELERCGLLVGSASQE